MTGRWRHGGPICETCPSIDVRRWQREERLLPGQSFEVAWGYDGERWASIRVHAEWEAVVLMFRVQRAEGSEDIQQRVPLTWTPCHLGGTRPWFRCSVHTRAAIAGTEPRCCTLQADPLRAEIATAWRTQANENPYDIVGSRRRGRFELGWEAAQICSTASRKGRRACTSKPTSVFVVCTTLPQRESDSDAWDTDRTLCSRAIT
jgi:hypothetical protein